MLEAHRKQGYTKHSHTQSILDLFTVYGPQHCTSPSPGECIVEEPATYSHLHPHI